MKLYSVFCKLSAGIPLLVHFLGILALFKNNNCAIKELNDII